MPPARDEELRVAEQDVRALAAVPRRGSATPGEIEAARWVGGRFAEAGLDARIEAELAHGTHWWPYGLPCGAAALSGTAALLRRTAFARAFAAAVGLLGAAAVIEDVAGDRRMLRGLLPKRRTANVIAELGARDAPTTVVAHAHHDAAHGGLMFHPAISRVDGPLPSMATVAAGPLGVGLAALLGARRSLAAAVGLAATNAALFADSGLRSPVPGANDDASGVAALILLAGRLAEEPPEGVRVILLSTGSEESMLEGMTAWAARHLESLDRSSTFFISVDPVGWERLALRTGEGALRLCPASPRLRSLFRDAAERRGIEIRDGVRFWIPTDGYVALKAGFPEVNLGSEQADGSHPGYHSVTDVPDAVDYATVVDATDVTEDVIRRIGALGG